VTSSAAYSRIYHRLMTEYPSVWRSPTQLALYVHLLVAAEKYYPEWPTANRRNGAYQSLVKAGLVIEKEGTDGYTIRGLEAERERRSHAGRNAAASRWGMPRRDEQENRRDEQGAPHTNGTNRPLSEEEREASIEEQRKLLSHPHPAIARAARKALEKLEAGR
jgi:hypothetical protein